MGVKVPVHKRTHLLLVRINGASNGSMLEYFHSGSAGGLQSTGLKTGHAGFLQHCGKVLLPLMLLI